MYEAKLTPAEEYLNVTVTELRSHYQKCIHEQGFYCEEGTALLPEDMKGVYLASDDSQVIDEIRSLVLDYLPNVIPERVVYMSDGEVSVERTKAAHGTRRT